MKTITIDIDKIIDLLIKLGICVEVPQENKEQTAEPAPTEEPAVEPKVEDVPLEQIQKKVVDLCTAGKKAEARDIIQEHGEKVSDLVTPELRAAVWAKLIALEG